MADCGVCIGGGDFDGSWDFFNEKLVVARKEHKCCECYRVIPIGAKYQRCSGRWEGEMESYSTCLDCFNIRKGLTCEGEAWPAFGGLWEDVTYAFKGVVSTACLTKIPTASAKAYFLERWRKHKGLEA